MHDKQNKEEEMMERAVIESERAKKMRQAGASAHDYISLDAGRNHGEAEGVSDKEIQFSGRIGGFNGVEESSSVVVEEEEERVWEEEQFKKGLGKRKVQGEAVVESRAKKRYSDRYAGGAAKVGPSIGEFPGSNGLSIAQQAEVTRKVLKDNVFRLKESYGRTIASLSITDENMSASILKVASLEKALSAASEKFIFMQKLGEFVSVALADKSPMDLRW